MTENLSVSTPEPPTPKLKYQSDINARAPKDCPPNNAVQRDTKAYRLVNNPISTNDFKTYIQSGRLPRQTNQIHLMCAACGLSLFRSLTGAEQNVRNNFHRSKIPYSHIAEGNILKSHGVCTPEGKDSHFTIHEFDSTDLTKVFTTIVQDISHWKI